MWGDLTRLTKPFQCIFKVSIHLRAEEDKVRLPQI